MSGGVDEPTPKPHRSATVNAAGAAARLLSIVALTTTLLGCTNADRLFEPRWNQLIEREGDRDRIAPEAIPEPIADRPRQLPDLTAAADGPIDLSVEQAVFLALQQNRDLQVTRLNPVITGAFELVERGRFDPEVFASAEFTREEILESARATGEQFSVRGDFGQLRAGVRQETPYGTDIELDVTQQRSISNRSPEQQEARLGLTITQSLIRGFGPAVNLADVRQAELDTLASLYELRGYVESLLADTEIAYWNYLLAEREIRIVERALEVARQQADQIEQRIEVGVLAETEAAAALSEVARREQALIDARAAERAAALELFRLLDLPLRLAGERDVQPTSDIDPPADPLDDLDLRIELAKQLRPDLNQARLLLDQNRLETIQTRNGLLPRLDFFVALGKTGFADTFTASFRELDGPSYDYALGLSFAQTIDNRAARGRYRAALASRQQAAASVVNLEQLVELDVLLAANDAERARQQIDASRTTRELQEQTAQAEAERFEVGASTALLVAQAQRDLLEAQIAEVEAIANYRIALIRLYLAEGSLLERRGVNIRH